MSFYYLYSAYAESFMKTLKSEEVHLWEYRTMADVHCGSDSSGSILGGLQEAVVGPHYHTLWAIQ